MIKPSDIWHDLNNPKGRVPRLLGVGEWNFAVRRRAKLEMTSATGLPVSIYHLLVGGCFGKLAYGLLRLAKPSGR